MEKQKREYSNEEKIKYFENKIANLMYELYKAEKRLNEIKNEKLEKQKAP